MHWGQDLRRKCWWNVDDVIWKAWIVWVFYVPDRTRGCDGFVIFFGICFFLPWWRFLGVGMLKMLRCCKGRMFHWSGESGVCNSFVQLLLHGLKDFWVFDIHSFGIHRFFRKQSLIYIVHPTWLIELESQAMEKEALHLQTSQKICHSPMWRPVVILVVRFRVFPLGLDDLLEPPFSKTPTNAASIAIVAEVIYPFHITKRLAVTQHGRVLHRWKGTHAQSSNKSRIVRMVGSNLKKRPELTLFSLVFLQMMLENCLDPWAYGRMFNPDWSHQTFHKKLVRSAQGGILLPNDQDPAHVLVTGGNLLYGDYSDVM